jgi:subtilisin family serine protease
MTPDSEYVPFGITMTKGDSSLIPAAAQGSSSACSDANTNCKGISIGIDDLPWYDPKGRAGHGTHVFGTIGAIGGNNEGVTSMVPNSDGICYLIARVFDDEQNGIYASAIFEAIDWAVTEGANVINMSLGAGSYYQAGQDAIDAAHAKGILSVASAGNSQSSALQYPASLDHVISVAAVKDDGQRASFSTYNDKVDVAAPGVGTVSTYIGNRYASLSGTSMAAPHVTGAIAKVWSVCRQCSSARVESCLFTTASSYPSKTNQLGFGIIDADDMYSCLVNTDGCCAETRVQEVEPVVVVPEQVEEPEPVAVAPEQVQAQPAQCNRRDIGERCRRDAHCCSGKCSSGFTCLAA